MNCILKHINPQLKMKQQRLTHLKTFNIVTSIFVLLFILLCSTTSLSAQSTTEEAFSYIASPIRALMRAEEVKKNNEQISTLRASQSSVDKFNELKAKYMTPGDGPDQGFQDYTNYMLVPSVRYNTLAGQDTYYFFTGQIKVSGNVGSQYAEPKEVSHVGNVNKIIEGEIINTLYNNGQYEMGGSIQSNGFNMILRDAAYAIATEKYEETRKHPRATVSSQVAFLVKEIEAKGDRGASNEIILLSVAEPEYQYFFNGVADKVLLNPEGVYETRMYPDDYMPTITTQYSFYFTEGYTKPIYFAYQIDSEFGKNDRVDIVQNKNNRGMYIVNPFNNKPYRFSYISPQIFPGEDRGIQYQGNDQNFNIFTAFDDGRDQDAKNLNADGAEVTKMINLRSGEDTGMFFKDKGHIYKAGDIFSTTLYQGVSTIVRPEVNLKDGVFNYKLAHGEAFDLDASGLVWIDENNGDGVSDPKSNGGSVSIVRMNAAGTTEIAGTTKVIGTYTAPTASKVTGKLTYTGTNYRIPSSDLSYGKNIYKLTITNKVRRPGTSSNVETSSVEFLTIDVQQSVKVYFKNGTTDLQPAETHVGSVGDDLTITFPKVLGGIDYQSVVPATLASDITIGTTNNELSTAYSASISEITFKYGVAEVEVIVVFRQKDDIERKVYANINNNSNYASDILTEAEPGTSITTFLQQLVTSKGMKYNFDGYKTISIGDYEVEGETNPITTIPDRATKIIYKYTGERSPLK